MLLPLLCLVSTARARMLGVAVCAEAEAEAEAEAGVAAAAEAAGATPPLSAHALNFGTGAASFSRRASPTVAEGRLCAAVACTAATGGTAAAAAAAAAVAADAADAADAAALPPPSPAPLLLPPASARQASAASMRTSPLPGSTSCPCAFACSPLSPAYVASAMQRWMPSTQRRASDSEAPHSTVSLTLPAAMKEKQKGFHASISPSSTCSSRAPASASTVFGAAPALTAPGRYSWRDWGVSTTVRASQCWVRPSGEGDSCGCGVGWER